jgi:hypothetical protein
MANRLHHRSICGVALVSVSQRQSASISVSRLASRSFLGAQGLPVRVPLRRCGAVFKGFLWWLLRPSLRRCGGGFKGFGPGRAGRHSSCDASLASTVGVSFSSAGPLLGLLLRPSPRSCGVSIKGFLFWLGFLRSAAASFAPGSGIRRRQ